MVFEVCIRDLVLTLFRLRCACYCSIHRLSWNQNTNRHSRICMLAITGYITVDLGFIVHPYGAGLTSATAHDALVEKGVMGNALVFIGLFEIVSYLGVAEMLQGSGREPGDFGFGDWYLEGKTPEQVKLLKYQEIKNGRLAMMAFGGVVTQSVLFDASFPYIGPTP